MPSKSVLVNESYYKDLSSLLDEPKNDTDLFQTIVNAPFHDQLITTGLDLGIIVLLLVNPKTKVIDRVALSETDFAKGAVRVSAKPFNTIKIPIGYDKNIISRAISTGEPQQTGDWENLFTPALTAQQARFNQSGAGIECSVVCPFVARSGGALIYSFYQPPYHISDAHHDFIEKYTSLVNQALEI